ncbi:hypothetical protein JS531_10620 [Bifidobacterium sp. CP2]|uniref:hypothetical protein n=1 Tax=Bifidobacterium sp. CP2 TaxID=2809025 RepID=UPI001BDD704A|nr:hypothetical protein [Bifidobacterium sp. CP2]MBT1182389.1 hypothetical protein [Bifidobacterium sp. CP2]
MGNEVNRTSDRQPMPRRRRWTRALGRTPWSRPIAIAAIVILLLELFVFNLPFWQTLGTRPTQAHDEGVGNGLAVEQGKVAIVTDPEHAWRDISADEPIDYLYIDHAAAERPRQDDAVRWQVSTMKPTDSGWYDANADVGYSPSAEYSRYQRIGDGSTHVRLRYQMAKGAVIPYNTITVNPRIPMRFSPIRLTVEILTALLVIMFRPASPLYRRRLALHRRACLVPVAVCAAITCILPLALFAMAAPQESPDPVYWDTFASYQATDQYQRLADAILHGRTWLDYPVNGALAAMDNPYDTRLRTLTALNHPDTPVYFDVAFHDGRYYSYFGVLPALLLFAPFKALTGMRLPTNAGVAIAVLMAGVATALLCIQLARLLGRRRPVSLGAAMLGMTAMMFGNGIAMLVQLGLFYQIPQEMAVAFAAFGLSLWIEAKLRGLERHLPLLAAGSACMALTIASRPQVILATLVAIPLFSDEIRTLWTRGLRSLRAARHEAVVWAWAVLPYLAVFLPQFAYNRARFGKFTDFGATYNLTGYDMPHADAPLTQYLSFVFQYLFQPPNLTSHFPFVQPQTVPLTTWRSEHPMFGGWLFTAAPFALLLFTVLVWRFALRRLAATRLVVGASAAFALTFVIDARVTGVDFRYEIDFGFMIMIAVLVLLYAVDAALNAPADVGEMSKMGETGSPVEAAGPLLRREVGLREVSLRDADWRDVARRLTFGWFAAGVVAAFLFLVCKQFASGMNMPVAVWWDTASWFVFM